MKGNVDGAIADLNEAVEMSPNDSHTYNQIAWELAAGPDAKFRNGPRAVEFAKKACDLTGWNNEKDLDTYAAACAEVGDYDEAVKWETKCLGFKLPEDRKESAQARLRLYESKEPYHQRENPFWGAFLQQTRSKAAVSKDDPPGVIATGVVANGAQWKDYKGYLNRMMLTVQGRWDRLSIDRKGEAPTGTHIVVRFTLDAKGGIAEILDVESTSDEAGKQCCLTAITSSAPYDRWTSEMIAALGSSQEISFSFYYE